jgi:hypothetical protein
MACGVEEAGWVDGPREARRRGAAVQYCYRTYYARNPSRSLLSQGSCVRPLFECRFCGVNMEGMANGSVRSRSSAVTGQPSWARGWILPLGCSRARRFGAWMMVADEDGLRSDLGVPWWRMIQHSTGFRNEDQEVSASYPNQLID